LHLKTTGNDRNCQYTSKTNNLVPHEQEDKVKLDNLKDDRQSIFFTCIPINLFIPKSHTRRAAQQLNLTP